MPFHGTAMTVAETESASNYWLVRMLDCFFECITTQCVKGVKHLFRFGFSHFFYRKYVIYLSKLCKSIA